MNTAESEVQAVASTVVLAEYVKFLISLQIVTRIEFFVTFLAWRENGLPPKNQYLVKRVVGTFVDPVTGFDTKAKHSNKGGPCHCRSLY